MPHPQLQPRPAFPDLGRFWTVANGLTLLRMALVFPIAILVYRGGPFGWLMGLLLFAIATDWFDGQIARWSNTVSEWGKVLDPTADKLAAAAVTLALVLRPAEAGATLPLWFVGVVILRDLVIAVGGILQTRRLGRVLMSLWSGKIAVTALSVTVVAALLDADAEVLAVCVWATTALLFYSLLRYLWRFGRVMRGLPVTEGAADPADALRERLSEVGSVKGGA